MLASSISVDLKLSQLLGRNTEIFEIGQVYGAAIGGIYLNQLVGSAKDCGRRS